MELVVLYNTESFNHRVASKDPITRDSVIKVFDFNPEKRYKLKSIVTKGTINENVGLFETRSTDFYDLSMEGLLESTNPAQASYIAGSVGLRLDRMHLVRSHYHLVDLVAFAGGLLLAGYVIIYVAIYLYQKIERKIYIVKNIFYFAAKMEAKVSSQPLNFKIKSELGSRYRITRASIWQAVTCRGGRFFRQI